MQGKQFLFLVRFENVISVAMADPLVVKVDVGRIDLSLNHSPWTQTECTLRKYYVCRLQPHNRKDINTDKQVRTTVGVGLRLDSQSEPLGALARLFALGIGGPPPGEEHKCESGSWQCCPD